MIQTMCDEIVLRKNYTKESLLQSIYFGGGTPSLLNEEELKQIFTTIRGNYEIGENTEITLEVNPDDISAESLIFWKEIGINRLSIGLQSFREKDLAWMNRAHSVAEALSCVELAQKYGFNSISVDLIYGLPDLSMEEWEQHVDTVLAMNIQHISAYCLTIEEKTALHHLVKQQKISPGGEEEQRAQFLSLSKKLKDADFHHYEISNFGKIGFEALHNTNYWRGKSYLGIGPSAHSFNGVSRRWNVANNLKYIKEFSGLNWFEEEELSAKDQWNELLLTGLRTSYGVDLKQLASIQKINQNFTNKTTEFIRNNWMLKQNNTLLLTEEGRLMADHIASELFL